MYDNKLLKKTIKYRLSYSGTKETDILYRNIFLKNFDKFQRKDLLLLKNLFEEFSDNEIYLFLTQKTKLPTKYKTFLEKNINEK
tara:strand:- start:1489 stop:1740 length:252 start_codon:yes stop_codon:yes gene_type:complete